MSLPNAGGDIVEEFDGAIIQYGPNNNRVYLMKFGATQQSSIASKLIDKAWDNGYTKVFAKVPSDACDQFLKAGYEAEACVPGYFNGSDDAHFFSFYLDEYRRHSDFESLERSIKEIALSSSESKGKPLPPMSTIRALGPDDVPALSELYKRAFPSYPFPIHDQEYLLKTMKEDVLYFCVEIGGSKAAVSSAEVDRENANAELTDFATHDDWQGMSLALHLLQHMESVIRAKGIKTAYTIARARSIAMNKTFSKAGYDFGGYLPNNTNIFSGIESMNVWHKRL